MIINKQTENLKGTVEYLVQWHEDPITSFEDDNEFYEYENFTNLKELISAMTDEKLEDIKNHFDAKEVKIVGINFSASSNDEETSSLIMVGSNYIKGWVTTKINNDDIDNRLLINVKKLKEIIDNTLDEYPIKY